MASLEVIRAYKALNLNALPELLNVKQIATLHYPLNDKTHDRECIEEYIQTAIDNGRVEISSGAISKPDTSKKMQIISLGSSIPKRPERELDEWIELFNGLDCGTGVVYSEYGGLAFLKERLSNGWPSEWEVQIKSFIHQYSLIPLISSSHYEAWTDKPEPTEGSFLNGWLGISKQGNDKQQVNVDAGKGSNAGTGTKLLNQFDNEFKFSGLLKKPSGVDDSVDDWFEVIDAMTKDYYLQLNNSMPTKAQAWARLCENPPTGYGITANKDNLSITMIGIVKPFNKRSFDRRWAKYTAKSSQI